MTMNGPFTNHPAKGRGKPLGSNLGESVLSLEVGCFPTEEGAVLKMLQN